LNTLVFNPGAAGLARLDQLGQMFELWRLKRATLRYATAVGTVAVGAVYIGIDFDPDDLPTTLQGVQALTPLARIPVWEEGSVGIQVNRVNKATWMYTSATANHPGLQKGFAACIWNTGPMAAGEMWLDYEIELTGAAANQSLSRGNEQLSTLPMQLTRADGAYTLQQFVVHAVNNVGVTGLNGAVTPLIFDSSFGQSAGSGDVPRVGYSLMAGIWPLIPGLIYDLLVQVTGSNDNTFEVLVDITQGDEKPVLMQGPLPMDILTLIPFVSDANISDLAVAANGFMRFEVREPVPTGWLCKVPVFMTELLDGKSAWLTTTMMLATLGAVPGVSTT